MFYLIRQQYPNLSGTVKISPQRHGEHREDREKEDFMFPSLFQLCDSLCPLHLCGCSHFPFYNAIYPIIADFLSQEKPFLGIFALGNWATLLAMSSHILGDPVKGVKEGRRRDLS
jgi:hypothetical protein